jgi:hypothetical protein
MNKQETTLTEWEALELFKEALDEWADNVKLFGMEYLPSQVLESTDPIAFRVMFHDWIDQENLNVEGYN